MCETSKVIRIEYKESWVPQTLLDFFILHILRGDKQIPYLYSHIVICILDTLNHYIHSNEWIATNGNTSILLSGENASSKLFHYDSSNQDACL